MNNRIINLWLSCQIVFALVACNSSGFEEVNDVYTSSLYTYRMHLDGCVRSYDDDQSSRASMTVADGTKLYLNFGGKIGTAVYQSRQNEWSLTYTGELSGSGTCTACYISDITEDNGVITLTPMTAIYTSNAGTYNCSSDGSITVKATLTPILSRFRLRGEIGTQVQVKGIKVMSSLSLNDFTYDENVPETISVTVGTSGFSQYIYYIDKGAELLSVIYGNKAFTISNPLRAYANCISGYIDMPTLTNHDGWKVKDVSSEPNAVDLGLSVKWAKFNVGANTSEEYGYRFKWGETEPTMTADQYWTSYKWCNGSETTLTKYCTDSAFGIVDNKTVLDSEDDVAHVKWGGAWRMPTENECRELSGLCTWEEITQNGHIVYKVTGPNGNYIFIPSGDYWTSSLHIAHNNLAYLLCAKEPDRLYSVVSDRCYVRLIRPVCP